MKAAVVAAAAAGLCGALLAGAAVAQPYTTPPPPAPPRPLVIAAPIETRLDNGLRVIVARRADVPLVSTELVVFSGSEADPPRLAGLASVTAALLTQGTTRRSAPEIAAAAESLGGSLDSGSGWNQSRVAITVTTPRLDAALGLVAEVAREPAFAPDELDRVRTQTLDGLKVAYANPGTLAALVAERLAYGASAYGHPASGTPESLPRIDRDSLVALHRRTWRPDNAVLILAGDIDAAAGRALAMRHFGGWANPPEALAPPPAPMAGTAAPSVAVVDMPKSGQAAVVIDIALPERDAAGQAVGDVLNSVLGGGYSSRLNLEIRIKRGLSYGARSGVSPRQMSALFNLSVQTKNETAAEVVALIDAELDRLIAAPVPADELAARKAALIGGFSRSVETTAGLAGAIRSLVVVGRPPSDLQTRIATLEAVSADQVQRYAAAHLGSARRRTAVAGEAAVFGAALAAARPQLVTVTQAALDLERPDSLARP